MHFSYLGDNSRQTKTVDSDPAAEYLWDRAPGNEQLLDDGTTGAVHTGLGVLNETDDLSNDREFSLLDGLGSVRARTDDNGDVTDTASFDAWGSATDAPEGLFGWDGEQTDAETGLTYLRARYYSPAFGRFLSTDPVQPNAGSTQGYNAYAFGQNNPATMLDPSGMASFLGKVKDFIWRSSHNAIEDGQCILRNKGNVLACVHLEPLKKVFRVPDVFKKFKCGSWCHTALKWTPVVVVVTVVVVILIVCFPECEAAAGIADSAAADGFLDGGLDVLVDLGGDGLVDGAEGVAEGGEGLVEGGAEGGEDITSVESGSGEGDAVIDDTADNALDSTGDSAEGDAGADGTDDAGDAGGDDSIGTDERSVKFNDKKQLEQKYRQHADVFGLPSNYNAANGELFEEAVADHVANPDVVKIEGTFRGQPAIHYVDPSSGIDVFTDTSGNFWSAFRLNPTQLVNVLTRGSL